MSVKRREGGGQRNIGEKISSISFSGLVVLLMLHPHCPIYCDKSNVPTILILHIHINYPEFYIEYEITIIIDHSKHIKIDNDFILISYKKSKIISMNMKH